MSGAIREITQAVIRQVEELSGHSVEVMPDRSLSTMATVTMARGAQNRHVVMYNPASCSQPDYLIVYQCGAIIRRFSVPASQRKEFLLVADGKNEVRGMLKNIPASMSDDIAGRMFNGLMLQLRSYPSGLRVDKWILDSFPELASLQEAAVAKQLAENAQVLSPEVRDMTPAPIYNANVAMIGAFALFWAAVVEDESLALPYRSTAHFHKSDALLDLWKSIPTDPTEDYRLIDAWGEQLGLSKWYRWISEER